MLMKRDAAGSKKNWIYAAFRPPERESKFQVLAISNDI
jgi:hypothetical protein